MHESVDDDYCTCENCHHQVLRDFSRQSFIVNDRLDVGMLKRVTSLDRFKNDVLDRFSDGLDRECLVDIGSASGKFLYQNSGKFRQSAGIEVTPAAAEFAREVAGLRVFGDIRNAGPEITVATCWHSLEHIPPKDLIGLMEELASRVASAGRVIVSVPNSMSFQYRAFRKAYAFYDVPNHLHQFSPVSLRMLFKSFGFKEVSLVCSWPYNRFGYIQSLLNMLTRSHNYLYYRLKRGDIRPSLLSDVANIVFLPFLVPLGYVLALLDCMYPEKQGVMTICFEKDSCCR